MLASCLYLLRAAGLGGGHSILENHWGPEGEVLYIYFRQSLCLSFPVSTDSFSSGLWGN